MLKSINSKKIQYTVKPDFIEQNKTNILAVMAKLRSLDNQDINYSAYAIGDSGMFVHIVNAKNVDAAKVIGNLEEFKNFQRALKENIVSPPIAEDMDLVGSSFDWFAK